jgi:hypothetical protein
MSGPFDDETSEHGPDWPDEDFADQTDSWDDGPWNVKRDGERRRPSTAEQAVPWLIGLILALSGVVVVMTALIFTTEAGSASASPTPSESLAPTPTPTPEPTPTPQPTPSAEPTATPVPTPQYGALELLYRGRVANVPTVLLHDFTTTTAPAPESGVRCKKDDEAEADQDDEYEAPSLVPPEKDKHND